MGFVGMGLWNCFLSKMEGLYQSQLKCFIGILMRKTPIVLMNLPRISGKIEDVRDQLLSRNQYTFLP